MNLLAILIVLVLVLAALALFSHWVGARVDKAFPPPPELLEVEGERIHYRSFGSGPAIVMVHGLGGQMKHFDYLPLQELSAHCRIVLLDRPGSGVSPRRDDGKAAIAAQGRLVAGFIRALNLPQPPLLVGHSLGGAIVLAAALHDPGCAAGLALLAPLAHFSPRIPAPFRALGIRTPWLRRLFAQVFAIPLGILASRQTLEMVFGPDPAPADFPVRGGGLLTMRPRAFYATSTDMCAVETDLPRQETRYGELRLPVFILYGDADRVLDWQENGQALQRKLPQAQLEIVPGAGHMLPVARAPATAAWLERVARAVHGNLWNSERQ
jgi:pimeloyl-ACP methyl ester carboxylesterase